MNDTTNPIQAYSDVLERWGKVTPRWKDFTKGTVRVDDLLEFATKAGKIKYVLKIEKNLPYLNVHTQIDRFKSYENLVPDYKLLVAAPYIRKSQADVLIQHEIDYVDLVGNVHIHSGDIHVEGKRPVIKPDHYKGRMLQRSGLQVIFVLLTQPHAVTWSYRKLAQVSGVVHGSVGWVFRDMREQGFILGKGQHTTLARKKELLGLWVQGYGNTLRHKLVVARYRPMFKNFEEVMSHFEKRYDSTHDKWAISGTQAAYRMQHFYRDTTLTFFVDDFDEGCVALLKWAPDPNGSITQLHLFSDLLMMKADSTNEIPITHPLVTYAELMNDSSERAREAAKMLYDDYLKGIENED